MNPAHPASAEGKGRRSSTRTAEGTKERGRVGAGGARRSSPQGRRRSGLHVIHEQRAEDDGYRSSLATGLRASADAERLAQEIGFAEGRLLALRTAPPDLYGEMREQEDPEQALWMCFLSAYLSPLEDADPFAGIRWALEADWRAGELPGLDGIPLGPRTSHDPARGDATLRAYLQWAEHAGRSQIGRSGRCSPPASIPVRPKPGDTRLRRHPVSASRRWHSRATRHGTPQGASSGSSNA